MTPTPAEPVTELDVRSLPKPDRHPAIFAAFANLAVGEAMVLINDHEPRHLREEFERDYPGGYSWDRLRTERRDWRIRIGRTASTALPRVIGDTSAGPEDPDAAGSVWKPAMSERDLDANVIALPPGGTIEAHAGPDVDVLWHVVAGSGRLGTETGEVRLRPGELVWLPRRSRRGVTAGADGLRYLSVHRKRTALLLSPTRTVAD